jgi:hypothetical protein
MVWYDRELPIFICGAVGAIIIGDYFLKVPSWFHNTASTLKFWGTILAAFALLLGIYTQSRVNIYHIRNRTPERWWLSIVTFAILFIGFISGFFFGTTHIAYTWLFDNVLQALWTSMLGTTGFYITSAAFRAFRTRTLEATMLLLMGCFVVARNAPALVSLWPGFTTLGDWTMDVVVGGGTRGIVIGAAIGAIATGLRTLIGYETGYLGRVRE